MSLLAKRSSQTLAAKLAALLFGVLIVGILPTSSSAAERQSSTSVPEPNPFALPPGGRPDVTGIAPGFVFISRAEGQAWPINSPITLAVKVSARQSIRDVRRVRLFRVGPKGEPEPYIAFGDCDVFLTVRANFNKDDKQGFIQIHGLNSSFLEVSKAHGTLSSAHWLAVFETSDAEESPVFRLRRDSEKEYFSGAWRFVLAAPDRYTADDVNEASSQQFLPLTYLDHFNIHDKSVPCHIAKMTMVAGSEQHVDLVACADDGTPGQ